MNNVFVPPKDKFSSFDCSTPCDTDRSTALCEPLCDDYTFGPFKAPTTLYTYYEYPHENISVSFDCDQCDTTYLNKEIEYDIYQIIDDEELYVGKWVIKDKDGPNKREFKECGEYILRYCSEPPAECYPDCLHPEVPEIIEGGTTCCDDGYIDGLEAGDDMGNVSCSDGMCTWTPSFEPFTQFEIFIPPCCDISFTTSNSPRPIKIPSSSVAISNWSSKIFNCPIDSIEITASEDCISDVSVIVQR